MTAHVDKPSPIRRVTLGRSSMGEPMLYFSDALRIMGAEADGVEVDDILWRAAARLRGYAPKGLGVSVAYLTPTA